MSHLLEILTNGGRSVSRWMVSQDTSKYNIIPIFLRCQLLLPSHIQHAYSTLNFAKQSLHTFRHKPKFLAIPRKAFLQLLQILKIILFLFSLIIKDHLSIGNPQLSLECFKIVAHSLILIEAPLEEIGLHMFYYKNSFRFLLLHCRIEFIII